MLDLSGRSEISLLVRLNLGPFHVKSMESKFLQDIYLKSFVIFGAKLADSNLARTLLNPSKIVGHWLY